MELKLTRVSSDLGASQVQSDLGLRSCCELYTTHFLPPRGDCAPWVSNLPSSLKRYQKDLIDIKLLHSKADRCPNRQKCGVLPRAAGAGPDCFREPPAKDVLEASRSKGTPSARVTDSSGRPARTTKGRSEIFPGEGQRPSQLRLTAVQKRLPNSKARFSIPAVTLARTIFFKQHRQRSKPTLCSSGL